MLKWNHNKQNNQRSYTQVNIMEIVEATTKEKVTNLILFYANQSARKKIATESEEFWELVTKEAQELSANQKFIDELVKFINNPENENKEITFELIDTIKSKTINIENP